LIKIYKSYTEETMAHLNKTSVSTVGSLVVLALVVLGLSYLQPQFMSYLRGNGEGFQSTMSAAANYAAAAGQNAVPGATRAKQVHDAPEVAPAMEVAAGSPISGSAGCYPRDQLTPSELLPKDQNSVWAQQNPMGTGSLKGKNFLSAGALIGVNTVGQSLRNANYQLRSEPPNPQVPVTIFNVPTIEPDVNRRSLEIN
jgi:hypothetical protein